VIGIRPKSIAFSNPFALAISATKDSIAMITVGSKEFVNISGKKLSASSTNNWDLLPLLLAFFATKLIGADFTAFKTFILVFINLPDKMSSWQTFLL